MLLVSEKMSAAPEILKRVVLRNVTALSRRLGWVAASGKRASIVIRIDNFR